METTLSPYLLIFRNTSSESYQGLSPEQRQDLLRQWNDWYDRLANNGKVQHGHPLELAGRIVTHSGVTDGPFAEAKEAVGGYFFITASSLDEATEIAQQCPSLCHGITVEVRPVGQICPTLSAKPIGVRMEGARSYKQNSNFEQ